MLLLARVNVTLSRCAHLCGHPYAATLITSCPRSLQIILDTAAADVSMSPKSVVFQKLGFRSLSPRSPFCPVTSCTRHHEPSQAALRQHCSNCAQLCTITDQLVHWLAPATSIELLKMLCGHPGAVQCVLEDLHDAVTGMRCDEIRHRSKNTLLPSFSIVFL